MNLFDLFDIKWLFSWFCFANLFYFFGVKNDWQNRRIKMGLATSTDKRAPRIYDDKDKKTNFSQRGNCGTLYFVTSILSIIPVFCFYCVSGDKEIVNIPTHSVSLFIVCAFFIGVPLESNEIYDLDKDKMFVKTLNAVANIKAKAVEGCVSKEYKYDESYIISKIKEIFKNRDKLKQGALIMRINSDFFNQILPNDVDESKIEEMKDYSYRLLVLYTRSDITLLDELIKLFKENIFKMNISMLDILEFMENQEITQNQITENAIDQYLQEQQTKRNDAGGKLVSEKELTTMLDAVIV